MDGAGRVLRRRFGALLVAACLHGCAEHAEPDRPAIEAPAAIDAETVKVRAQPGDRIVFRSGRVPLHPKWVDARTEPEYDSARLRLIRREIDPSNYGFTLHRFEFEVIAAGSSLLTIVTTCDKDPLRIVATYQVDA